MRALCWLPRPLHLFSELLWLEKACSLQLCISAQLPTMQCYLRELQTVLVSAFGADFGYASPTSPTSHPQRRAPIATWRQDCAGGHWASPAVATLWIELRLARLRDLQLTLQQAREKASLVLRRDRGAWCAVHSVSVFTRRVRPRSWVGGGAALNGGDGLWCMVHWFCL